MHRFYKRAIPEDAASGSGWGLSQKRANSDDIFSASGSSSGSASDVNIAELPADPGLRKAIKDYHPNVQDAVRRAYLQKGPCQPMSHDFPQTKHGDKNRRFIKSWFGEYKDWLEYSIAKDAAFCLYCYLFKPDEGDQAGGETFVTKGFTSWRKPENLAKHIGSHNSSHNLSRQKCEALMNSAQSIIGSFEKSSNLSRNNEYRTRLHASITAIRYLLAQGLAFRGHDESESSLNRGNFFELLKCLGNVNETIKKVILENAQGNSKMTSPQIQQEIVNVCATETSNAIAKEIGSSFFSIMVDESRDLSVKEQMAVVLRFVNDKGYVMERFLGVVHVPETSAATLKKGLMALLTKHNFSMARLRGQGYDGASNMRGEFNGLKALILSEYKSAFYVHCFAHQLQLALVAVVKNHSVMDLFFFHITLLSNVIGASCKRLDILRRKAAERIAERLEAGEIESGRGLNQERTINRPGDTRWSSHYKALINLIVLYPTVIDVLEIIEKSPESGKKGEALKLLNELHSFEFVMCLHMMTKILGVTHDLCMALQRKDQDIVNAIDLVNVAKRRLQELRNNNHEWEEFLVEVMNFCKEHKIIVPDMEKPYEASSWRRRRAESTTNNHHYRVELFYTVIDMQSQELNNRFNEENMELLRCMSCLNPVNSFSAFDRRKLRRLAEFYPEDFSDADCIMLDNQLQTYILDVKSQVEFSDLKGIGDLAKNLVETGKHIVFNKVYLLLILALTLPVATASVERAFSAMNIIKSRLRNRIGDEWLNDALVTYIEKDVFVKIDDETIINRFQTMKTRRGHL